MTEGEWVVTFLVNESKPHIYRLDVTANCEIAARCIARELVRGTFAQDAEIVSAERLEPPGWGEMYTTEDRIARWVAWLLPRRVAKWCFVRVVAYATNGVDRNMPTVPNDIADEVIRAWDNHCKAPSLTD